MLIKHVRRSQTVNMCAFVYCFPHLFKINNISSIIRTVQRTTMAVFSFFMQTSNWKGSFRNSSICRSQIHCRLGKTESTFCISVIFSLFRTLILRVCQKYWFIFRKENQISGDFGTYQASGRHEKQIKSKLVLNW